MLKATKGFLSEILREKRDNLINNQSIYTFDSKKLMPGIAAELVRDIDDFIEAVDEMFKKGDVYIEILGNAGAPINETSAKIKTLKLICYAKANVGVNAVTNERLYWVIVAVNAEDTHLTDIHNRDIYRDTDGNLICVETDTNPMDRGHIVITNAKFRN